MKSLTENDWQDFFEENTWIFGYGLRYQILRVIQAQPNYGGATVSGDRVVSEGISWPPPKQKRNLPA